MKGMDSLSMTAVSSVLPACWVDLYIYIYIYINMRERERRRRRRKRMPFETVTHHANPPDALLKQLRAMKEFRRCEKEVCEFV